MRRPSHRFPPFAGKQERKSLKRDRHGDVQIHTRLARKNCEVSLSFHSIISDLLPNRKCMWNERRDLVMTNIFVLILSERHTNLCLLPLDRSPRLSSLLGAWSLDGRPTLIAFSYIFFYYLS